MKLLVVIMTGAELLDSSDPNFIPPFRDERFVTTTRGDDIRS